MVKPSLSAEIIRGVTQCLLSSARETSLSSVQATLYMMIMRRRAKPVGTLPLTMFGASLATRGGCRIFLIWGQIMYKYKHKAKI